MSTESFKVVLVGESGVGKTSIITQFMEQTFQDDQQSTTGGTYSTKSVICDGKKELKFEIWDTAGQERYRALTKMFYKDAGAAVMVYDISRAESFEELKNYWATQIKESSPQGIILVIVGNKSDLFEQEKVDEGEARKLAEELGAIYLRVSAKNDAGISNIFEEIAKKYTNSTDIKIKKDDGEEPPVEEEKKDKEEFKISNKKQDKREKRRGGFC